MVETTELAAALKALDAQMSAAGLLSSEAVSRRLDQSIARLDAAGFLALRTLPAFWTVLAFWEFPEDAEKTRESCVDVLDLAAYDEIDDAFDAVETLHDEQQAPSSSNTLHLPHPHSRICDARLGKRYEKLMLRLQRSAARGAEDIAPIERLEDILNLSEERLLKLDGVGKTYREDWYALKALYAQVSGQFWPMQATSAGMGDPNFDVHDDMLLNIMMLDASERKAVAKLERFSGSASIQAILNFSSMDQAAVKSWGKGSVTKVLKVRERVIDELQRIADGTLDFRTDQSSLITTRSHSFESVEALGNFLLGRLDSYLKGLDETRQLIFQYRWGFIDERLTLSEVGIKMGVSGERIRQLESKINKHLSTYLALDADDIWQSVQGLSHDELRLKMADLSACFYEQAHFHEFLEFVSHGRLVVITMLTPPPLGLLDDYFALHGTVIAQQTILDELRKRLGYDDQEAHRALLYLEAQDRVALIGGQVRPLRLKNHEAAAAILSEHPNGLPWLDIAQYANSRGISRSTFSEQIPGHGLRDSPLMYVSGKGVYRHIRFSDFETVDDAAIFEGLQDYFANIDGEVSHLSEAHRNTPALRQHDYYVVRYLVKMRGAAHGIFFNGKSQVDSISLNPEFDLYSQKKVILKVLQQAQAAMTANELAQLLKSRSLRHAKLYINELTLDNKLVQVDRMLYTTPDRAYENIDLDVMREVIYEILQCHDKPVDPSVIQAELNLRQGLAYTKSFYGSLARYFAQQQHWHRRQNLFGSQPVGFTSLTGAIELLCSPSSSMGENVDVLRRHIAITDEAARVSIYNWKAAKARIQNGISSEDDESD
ncbi:sigma factor-like helix-turn-helix DNA-binding protein [Pseudomonas sp.]|uniref:sigma factor-like helix-turn-helix DNA-binding protein n=1 Tax=Pseudomonas sp. TaxID=306 RepID=UPI0028A1D1C5|nr:sigma factor-like helix-turn-helix DNA-binding protein [Pseudomonas sp.]